MKPKMRFKQGIYLPLDCGERLEFENVHCAVLRTEGGTSQWRLSPEDIRRIQATDLLEPVPEPKTPGQVLYEAQGAEVCPFTVNWRPWEDLTDREKDYRERVAARLGIKGEE